MQFVKREVDTRDEKRIITGIIVSTRFAREIQRVYKKGIFRIPYLDRICSWCFDYMDRFGEAPAQTIQDIFETERQGLKSSAEADNIEAFLEVINQEWLETKEDFNADYFLEEARRYIERRTYEVTFERGKLLLERGKINEVALLLDQTKRQQLMLGREFQPFTEEEINIFDAAEMGDALFSLAGRMQQDRLENLMGPFERGQLIAYLAPMKRGKTWFLQETAFQALEKKLKVLFVSLEMGKNQMKDRFYRRLTASVRNPGDYTQVVFDCKRNQTGECKKPQRVNDVALFSNMSKIKFWDSTNIPLNILQSLPTYTQEMNYRPCTVCRGEPGEDYLYSFWFELMNLRRMTNDLIRKNARAFRQFFGNRFWSYSFPMYSASPKDVIDLLDRLDSLADFRPDVLIIDYADILKPIRGDLSTRDSLNEIWIYLKQVAMDRQILVVSATQSNREGAKKESLSMTHTAEDIRKCAVVDALTALNQTAEEKFFNIMRINNILHRSREFDERKSIVATQNLRMAFPILDVEWVPIRLRGRNR